MKTKLSIAALVCCAQLLIGCAAKNREESDVRGASTVAGSPACDIVATTGESRMYRIQPGDLLDISFYLSPELHQDLTVRPDGDISIPVAGNVHAQGLTPGQLEKSLDTLYSMELRDPKSTVRIDKSPWQVVYVEGQVGKPGAVPLQPGMTALQAIAASGGLTDAAGASKVVLIRRDACGNPHGEHLKLDKVLNQKDNEEDVALLPADIVVVPRSAIAQFDLNIKQYVRDAMPLETVITPAF
jgi:protein involved in polysaccharide export with SLBB domain